jgi:hypothetical protein
VDPLVTPPPGAESHPPTTSPEPSSSPAVASAAPTGSPAAASAIDEPGAPITPDGTPDPGSPQLYRPDLAPVSFATGDLSIGIEWIVPTFLLTVPGFLLIGIGLAQAFGGFVWLPLVRRLLSGDGRVPKK